MKTPCHLFALIVAASTISACGNADVEYFHAAPEIIPRGETATLAWSVHTARYCSLNEIGSGGGESVDPKGEFKVTPAVTTVYEIYCDSSDRYGHGSSAKLTITVVPPDVAVHAFYSSPSAIEAGEASTLEWEIENADSCEINPGAIAATLPTGTAEVVPDDTTLYSLSCVSETVGEPARYGSAYTTVYVNPHVTVSLFTAASPVIDAGQTTSLIWITNHATGCSISPGVGSVDPPSGSTNVSPAETTLYTLTCTGPGGPAVMDTTVMVNP